MRIKPPKSFITEDLLEVVNARHTALVEEDDRYNHDNVMKWVEKVGNPVCPKCGNKTSFRDSFGLTNYMKCAGCGNKHIEATNSQINSEFGPKKESVERVNEVSSAAAYRVGAKRHELSRSLDAQGDTDAAAVQRAKGKAAMAKSSSKWNKEMDDMMKKFGEKNSDGSFNHEKIDSNMVSQADDNRKRGRSNEETEVNSNTITEVTLSGQTSIRAALIIQKLKDKSPNK
jgi:hypothetical protein